MRVAPRPEYRGQGAVCPGWAGLLAEYFRVRDVQRYHEAHTKPLTKLAAHSDLPPANSYAGPRRTAQPSIFDIIRLENQKISATPAHRVSPGERINVHEPPGHLQSELSTRGIRLTRQRRVLLQVMEKAQRHLDAGA